MDLNVLATKPKDTRTESPPCQGQNTQQNINQRKNQRRKRKGNSLLTFITNTLKKKKKRGKQLPVKNSCVILGPDQSNWQNRLQTGNFCCFHNRSYPQSWYLIFKNCIISASTTHTQLCPTGAFLWNCSSLWAIVDNPSNCGWWLRAGTTLNNPAVHARFSFPKGLGE